MKNYVLISCLTLFLCCALSIKAQQKNEITTYVAVKTFLEEESFRKTGHKVSISLNQLIYYDYLEKLHYMIATKGESSFLPDIAAPLLLKTIKKYGLVPDSLWLSKNVSYETMYNDMLTRLKVIKLEEKWKEKDILPSLTTVLQSYLGTPIVNVNGLTPTTYMQEKLHIIPDEYYCFSSYGGAAFPSRISFPIAQNYTQQPLFYNIDLVDYQHLIQKGIEKNFPVGLAIDYTEEGYQIDSCQGKIDTIEINSQRINDESRQIRFEDESTTADMSILLMPTINNKESKGIKATQFVWDDCQGQFTYSWDYIRLKSLYLWVHKEVAKEILDDMIK